MRMNAGTSRTMNIAGKMRNASGNSIFTGTFWACSSTNALRRFRIMENAEELQRAMEYPWEKWIVFLHPAQRETVARSFGGPARVVLARHVVVTAALQELHVAVAQRLGLPEPRYANTAAGHWSPHVTLARRLDAHQLPDALRAVRVEPLRGQATALRVWDATTRTITTLE